MAYLPIAMCHVSKIPTRIEVSMLFATRFAIHMGSVSNNIAVNNWQQRRQFHEYGNAELFWHTA